MIMMANGHDDGGGDDSDDVVDIADYGDGDGGDNKYHHQNDHPHNDQVPRNFKAMTSRAQKLFRKVLDPEPEKRLQVFYTIDTAKR